MAISINWANKIIFVPKEDTNLIQVFPTEIRELNLNTFRLALKDLEDSEDGMVFPDTHRHNAEVTVAGLTLARVIEIINGYTVTFEDGQYAVNLPGANSNVGDVVNVNQVSIRTFNSAGLITVSSGSGLSVEEHDKLLSLPSLLDISGDLSDDFSTIPNAVRLELDTELDYLMSIPTSGSLTVEEHDKLMDSVTLSNLETTKEAIIDSIPITQVDELYKIFGLEPGHPLIVTLTSRTAAGINQNISIDSVNRTTTVTRV